MKALALVLCMVAGPAAAQQESFDVAKDSIEAPDGAVIRGLDKIKNAVDEVELAPGETIDYDRLKVTLLACRYPEGKENAEAFARIRIEDTLNPEMAFDGWMFASSPALNAFDHPRYDVWVVRCKI